jgi:hypothetical protein
VKVKKTMTKLDNNDSPKSGKGSNADRLSQGPLRRQPAEAVGADRDHGSRREVMLADLASHAAVETVRKISVGSFNV